MNMRMICNKIFHYKKAKKYWFEQFKNKGIAFSEVNTIDNVMKDDYFKEIDFFFTENHPSEGKLLGARNPLLLNKKAFSAFSCTKLGWKIQ